MGYRILVYETSGIFGAMAMAGAVGAIVTAGRRRDMTVQPARVGAGSCSCDLRSKRRRAARGLSDFGLVGRIW